MSLTNQTANPVATSSSAKDTSSRLTVPIVPASAPVAAAPAIAPRVPPTPMNPKSRLACSLVKRSAISDQKTETTNRLNTLIQT